jgi:glutathionylspermidine synthase
MSEPNVKLKPIEPRPQFENILTARGATWLQGPEEPTWFENKVYVFTKAEIDQLKNASESVLAMVDPAVERIIGDDRLLDRLTVPEDLRPYLRKTWERRDPGIYGRLDFCWDFQNEPVFYEYNADTAMCLFEALVMEPEWWSEHGMSQAPEGAWQWAHLNDALWRAFRDVPLRGGSMLFTSARGNDERMKGAFAIRRMAEAAGYRTGYSFAEDIQIHAGHISDLADIGYQTLFKTFWPWERMMHMPLGRAIAQDKVGCVEPFWKLLVQNKLFPVILWDMFEGHPNLLESYFEDDARCRRFGNAGFARKPIFGREGNNVEVVLEDGRSEQTSGPYGAAGWARQKLAPLPEVEGRYPLMGVWAVRGQSCGLTIREASSLITKNESPVVPHYIEP